MELSKQVVSLELAEKLKDLGIKQESLFYWFPHREMETHELIEWKIIQNTGGSDESCSAFTVAELGEMLPNYFVSGRINDNYQVEVPFEVPRKYREAKTEADARAKCLIYLIENKLITL